MKIIIGHGNEPIIPWPTNMCHPNAYTLVLLRSSFFVRIFISFDNFVENKQNHIQTYVGTSMMHLILFHFPIRHRFVLEFRFFFSFDSIFWGHSVPYCSLCCRFYIYISHMSDCHPKSTRYSRTVLSNQAVYVSLVEFTFHTFANFPTKCKSCWMASVYVLTHTAQHTHTLCPLNAKFGSFAWRKCAQAVVNWQAQSAECRSKNRFSYNPLPLHRSSRVDVSNRAVCMIRAFVWRIRYSSSIMLYSEHRH